MKRIILLFSLLFVLGISFSQVTMESGSQFIVSAGSTVVADNGIVNNGGTIDIALGAFLDIQGDIENNTSALFEATSEGTIRFNGTTAQEITGDTDAEFYGIVEIDNPLGVSFTSTETDAEQTIHGTLTFTNGLLTLNDVDLTLVNDVTTAGSGMYIQTNSAGTVKREVPNDETPVLFPVGKSAYNPVTLQNGTGGVTDTYRVRVVDAEPASSSTPHFVDRSWIVNEKNPGGSKLTVTPQWNTGEELTDFDRTNSSVGLTTDNGTNYEWGPNVAAVGTNPYTAEGSVFNSVGTFAVGDYYNSGQNISLKFFLAGAYNGSTMNQTLNTAGLIPLTDPYGLNTTVTSIPANAVDWVVVRLRDKNNSSLVLNEYAFFIDASGNLLDLDGNISARLFGATIDNYFIEVNHRNHNGVMTTNTLDLSSTSPTFDYTLNTSLYGTDPLVDMGSGVYGLRKGNVNGDSRIAKVGPPTTNDYTVLLTILGTNLFLTNLYSDGDINMDGSVRKVGPPATNDYTALLNSLGTNLFLLEQLP